MAARGFSLVEVLVAIALCGMAAGGLALATTTAVPVLQQARETTTALDLASARLEALRAGPRADGADTVTVGGTSFARAWRTTDGRGLPSSATVDVAWGGRSLRLATEVLP